MLQTSVSKFLSPLRCAGVPNITHIWSSYEDQMHHYLLMEYCSHGNLLELLQANGPCTEHWVATAVSKCCQVSRLDWSYCNYNTVRFPIACNCTSILIQIDWMDGLQDKPALC